MESTVGINVAFVSVKIDAEVYRAAKTVAAWRGISISEYLSQIVRPIADRDLAKLGREVKKQSTDPEE